MGIICFSDGKYTQQRMEQTSLKCNDKKCKKKFKTIHAIVSHCIDTGHKHSFLNPYVACLIPKYFRKNVDEKNRKIKKRRRRSRRYSKKKSKRIGSLEKIAE